MSEHAVADVRTPRGRRGTVATLVAVVALLVLAWGAAEAVYLAMHRRTFWLAAPDVARYARHTRLSDPVVLIVGIVVAALGVLLILAALVPPRRRLVELTDADPSVAAGITPRSLRRTLAAAAIEIDGITAAKVTGGRRLRVTATTALRDVEPLPGRVLERVTARLTQLEPRRSRTVRVHLDRLDA